MQLTYSSPAKINLFLQVIGQKPNGYHLIQSWFQYLDWCDYLSFSLNTQTQDIILNINSPNVALRHTLEQNLQDNLILKAAHALKKQVFHLNLPLPGISIILDKHLPIGAGLGGGSSNAATTLVALNNLWGLGLSKQDLMALGATLGADIPFFIFGHTAFVEGIGEKLSALPTPNYFYLVITPDVHIATPIIYQDPRLTRDTPSLTIDTLKHADPLLLHQLGLRNDLEMIVCKLSLAVHQSLNWLSQFGHARVTGSGSSVFLGFKTEVEAKKILNLLPKLLASTPVSGKIAQAVNKSLLYS